MFSRTDVIDPDSSAPARQNDSEWGGFANILDEQLKFRTEFVAQGSGRVAASAERAVQRGAPSFIETTKICFEIDDWLEPRGIFPDLRYLHEYT